MPRTRPLLVNDALLYRLKSLISKRKQNLPLWDVVAFVYLEETKQHELADTNYMLERLDVWEESIIKKYMDAM